MILVALRKCSKSLKKETDSSGSSGNSPHHISRHSFSSLFILYSILSHSVDPNPFLRSTFWMVSVGLTTMWISNVGITPECVQRFVAIPKLSDAIKACWIFGVGHIFIKLFAVYNGLLIFAKYTTEKCDPVYDGVVGKYDQIFPYYVMDVARNIPGLPGLFIVGALSAALSSMSSCLNSLSGTVYEDFIRPYMPNTSDKTASTIMKVLTFSIGK